MPDLIEREIRRLFREHKVVDIKLLSGQLSDRSQRSLVRDLQLVHSLSSYSHAGRYYTLPRIARFDSLGLWHHDEIGFSRYGTLKSTITHWINESEAGYTYLELKDRVIVRIDNVLRELVAANRIQREGSARGYVYYSMDELKAHSQCARRSEYMLLEDAPIPETLIVEVLAEVIRGSKICVDIRELSGRLQKRDIAVSLREVAVILELYGVKKTLGSK